MFVTNLPLMALSVALFVASLLGVSFDAVPDAALVLSMMNLVLGNGLMIHLNMMGPFKRSRYTLVAFALLNPRYWVLHSWRTARRSRE